MPNQTIEQLTTIASARSNIDLLPIYETPVDGGAGLTRKITPASLLEQVASSATAIASSVGAREQGGSYFNGIQSGGKIEYDTSSNALIRKQDFTFWVKFDMPKLTGNGAVGSTNYRTLFSTYTGITSNAPTALISNQSSVDLTFTFSGTGAVGDAIFKVLHHDGTNQKESYYTFPFASFAQVFTGKIVNLVVSKTAAGILFYVNGELFTPTVTNHANGAVVTSSIRLVNNKTTLGLSGVGTDRTWIGAVYNFALFNRAFNQQDAIDVGNFGISRADQWARSGYDVSGIPSLAYGANTDSWASSQFTNTVVTYASSQLIATKSGAAGQIGMRRLFAQNSGVIVVGKRYRAGGNFVNNTGNATRFAFGSGYGTTPDGAVAGTLIGGEIASTGNGIQSNEFVATTQVLMVYASDANGVPTTNTASGDFRITSGTGSYDDNSNTSQFYLVRLGCILCAGLNEEGYSDLAVSLNHYPAAVDNTFQASLSAGTRNNTPTVVGTNTAADPTGKPSPNYNTPVKNTAQSVITTGSMQTTGGYYAGSSTTGIFIKSHLDNTVGRNGMIAQAFSGGGNGSGSNANAVQIVCNGQNNSNININPVAQIVGGGNGASNSKQNILIGGVNNDTNLHNALGFAEVTSGQGTTTTDAGRGYIYFDGTNLKLVTPTGTRTITAV